MFISFTPECLMVMMESRLHFELTLSVIRTGLESVRNPIHSSPDVSQHPVFHSAEC